MSLIKKIKDYYKSGKSLLFTTPSHSQGEFITKDAISLLGKKFFKCDFSEIDGFDNLRNPTGILNELQLKTSHIYNSKYSFILTNGSSSGILALALSVLKENDDVLVARNCHTSVYNSLVLTGAKPVWLLPKYNQEWGIYEGVCPQKTQQILASNPNIKAVFITSPTYEGVYSDVEKLSEITRKYGVKLIVDEAHGALTNFGDFKVLPAILSGADASVQSLHKTAGSPNPCALLHLSKSTEISRNVVQNALNIVNTTSPSYPLIIAAEATINFLDSIDGRNCIKKLLEIIQKSKNNAKNKFVFYDQFNDPTKLLLKIPNTNLLQIAEKLNEKYKIEEEFSTEKAMLFITGIGTTQNKLQKLFERLNNIEATETNEIVTESVFILPQTVFSPREAYFKPKIDIATQDSEGQICGELIISYPPGIPTIVPGERIDKKHLSLISKEKIKILN